MEKLCPTACVYENVKTASERTRDDDGTLHRPAVEANLRKITPNKYDRGEREREGGREGEGGTKGGREGISMLCSAICLHGQWLGLCQTLR